MPFDAQATGRSTLFAQSGKPVARRRGGRCGTTAAWPGRWLAACCCWLALWCGATASQAQPATVVVGTYVNKVQDLSFKDNRYVVDFVIWFRWKAAGALADYKPLESMEIINGRIDAKSSLVEKKIDDLNYAAMRVTATMTENWQLATFPFDAHRLNMYIEDSARPTDTLVFVADRANSRLGDEIDMAGWRADDFQVSVRGKEYHSNYGDFSLGADPLSEYSRVDVAMSIRRLGYGSAVKLLSTVLLATAVAFVAFMVKPSDLDARFGMGVGSLFAVAASAFVVSASVPDSGVMTVADNLHMVALGFIFLTLLISAICLKFEVSGREALAYRIDRWCLVLLPLAFYGWALYEIGRSLPAGALTLGGASR